MSANTAQNKAPWLLAILLLSQVVLMSVYARHPESEQSMLRTWLMTPYAYIGGGLNRVLSAVVNTVGSYTDLRQARQENIDLRARLEEMAAELNQTREQAKELELIRSHLALPALPQYPKLAANVISRNSSLWFKRLTIDRGSLDGVKKNMPVVTGSGLVGRVINVGPNFAQIQAITDSNAGVGVMLQSSRVPGELKGQGDKSRCELVHIPASEEVQEGEVIVTTGLDRIYPKGLMVGTIERIENDPNAPWHKLIVKPSAPIDRLEHVLVLLVEQKDLKVEETIK